MRNVQQRKTAKGILTCTKKKKKEKKREKKKMGKKRKKKENTHTDDITKREEKKRHTHTKIFEILDSMSQFYARSLSCDLCGIGEVLYLLLSE